MAFRALRRWLLTRLGAIKREPELRHRTCDFSRRTIPVLGTNERPTTLDEVKRLLEAKEEDQGAERFLSRYDAPTAIERGGLYRSLRE